METDAGEGHEPWSENEEIQCDERLTKRNEEKKMGKWKLGETGGKDTERNM